MYWTLNTNFGKPKLVVLKKFYKIKLQSNRTRRKSYLSGLS